MQSLHKHEAERLRIGIAGGWVPIAAAVRHLYELACSGLLPEEHFGWEPYALEDSYYLARTGTYGTAMDALQEVRDYLARVSRRTG